MNRPHAPRLEAGRSRHRSVAGAALLVALALAGGSARGEEAPLAVPAAPAVASPGGLALDAGTYGALSDALRPSEQEQAWRQVGWRPSFAEAVLEARAAGKPVFLWAMNGHPLACT